MSFAESYALLAGGRMDRYSCSAKNESEWLSQGVRRPLLGSFLLVSGSFFEALYIPILYAMLSSELIRNSSILIMFYLGCLDALSLVESAFYPGYQVIVGGSFCTHPISSWIMGKYCLFMWVTSSTTCALLTVARYAEVARLPQLRWFFEKKWRVLGLLLGTTSYGLVLTIPSDTLLFNSVYVAYFFNPLNEKDPALFRNPYQNGHNILVVIVITVFHVLIVFKIRKDSAMWRQNSAFQKSVTMQSCIISLLYAISGYTYVYFNWFEASFEMVVTSHIVYMLSSGIPGVVYLLMNHSIRNRLAKILTQGRIQTTQINAINSSTLAA